MSLIRSVLYRIFHCYSNVNHVGFFSKNDIDELLKESEKMKSFKHPNVLSLIGVSIDAGEAPFIVMPFMTNGSLLAYLRKERPHLTIAEEASAEDQLV